MPKLTDSQLMLLSKATQQDGLLVIPANLKGAAATKAVKPLLAHGLVKEVPSTPDMPAWRRDEAEGQSYALVITQEGRSAINAEDVGEKAKPPKPAPKRTQAARAGALKGAKASGRKDGKREAKKGSPRPGSKLAKVIGLLTTKAGTTIDAIVKATDWLPHTTRAALTGLRKRGYRLEKERRQDGRTTYRIVGGAGVHKAPTKTTKKRPKRR